MLATSISMNAFTASINTVLQANPVPVVEEAVTPEMAKLQVERELVAAKINAYYARHNLPLQNHGMKMVLAGEKYGVEPTLLAAIAMRESTGGKFVRSYNAFGWGTARFESFDHAIDVVAMNLGGHNPRTQSYYKGKTITGMLKTYNSVIPTYAPEVIAIKTKIENMKI